MTFFEILSTLLIGPLKLLFEVIFVVADRFLKSPGLSIIVLSLIMNVLVLPLYRRADAMQEAARDTEARLHKGVAHIKKAFTGDERMMILQAYYRQNHYKPTDALRGSVSLLLEIPFFMAAYQFLSGLKSLQQVSFGPIADLSAPDGLLVLGGLTLNLLPVVMTLINVISSAIYLKGFPTKTKVQLYAMAAFFLVFLYGSPSGLVFYWTLNNLFSLVKTIFYKLKNPKKVLSILGFGVGLGVVVFGLVFWPGNHPKLRMLIVALGLVMMCPLAVRLLKIPPIRLQKGTAQPNQRNFLLSCLFITLLVGVLIPSTFIAASPQEYVDMNNFLHPLWYVVSATALAAGTFLVWFGVFYWLASPGGKVLFERLACIACVAMLVNYMFFGTDLGNLSPRLVYDTALYFRLTEQIWNLVVLVFAAAAVFFLCVKWGRVVPTVLLTAVIALGCMSGINVLRIISPVEKLKEQMATLQAQEEQPTFSLSRKGKNVIVLMMDRALGNMVPYILNEKPELETQFDGFTYYSNVISHGRATNFGTPGLYGGYEYTPVEMNKRDTEPLASKQNEALKVMPVLFSEHGYHVTVCDPTYAGYQWVPDLSIYSDYPGIQAYVTEGHFGNGMDGFPFENLFRNFFCFGIVKTMPLTIQGILYNEGEYNVSAHDGQVVSGLSTAEGLSPSFLEPYNVVTNLPAMTRISDSDEGTFLMMSNTMTHDVSILQAPDYVPEKIVDNTAYDEAHEDRFVGEDRDLLIQEVRQMAHYHVNMSMFLRLGEWFDTLRDQGVYDNTRIIIVSDHGYYLETMEDLLIPDRPGESLECFYPLLMVKDFDAKGFTTSDTFMTNADVPTLATQNLIEDAVNPFTGKPISSDEKTAHDQMVIMSGPWDIMVNNGTTFRAARWASVHDDLWNMDNWTFYDEEIVLKEHALP